MASRNIASMHLFLEMKKKFPDLPEDTLRDYACRYAQDQEKCLDVLQRENRNHFHSRQQFSDIRLSESKANEEFLDEIKPNMNQELDIKLSELKSSNNIITPLEYVSLKQNVASSPTPSSNRSTSHAGVLHLPSKCSNLNVTLQPEPKSAPVISSSNRPFANIYNQNLPASSHTVMCHYPDKQQNRMMFSTTQEHKILPVEPLKASNLEPSKRHAVRLNITPSFPFSQQQITVPVSSVSTSSSHTSKSSRHTTSLNFQLQSPQASDSGFPMEISTVPTNIGSPCKYPDFGSHLQISVSPHGATFTALRLQRPSNLNLNQPSISGHQALNISSELCSRPERNSKVRTIPVQIPEFPKRNNVNISSQEIESTENLQSRFETPTDRIRSPSSFMHGFRASPDYFTAVKNHQLARLQFVLEELNKEKKAFSELRRDLEMLEHQLSRRKEKETSRPDAELQKLKDENNNLQKECNNLVMEYDLNNKGQIGVTDEDFYSNIFTGPDDGLSLPSSDDDSPKENISRKKSGVDDDDEKNTWKCKNCTFENHPALEKCEICELPKDSGSFFVDS